MNGSRKENSALLAGLKSGVANIKKTAVAVCPPFVYISEVAGQLAGSAIAWGAQNVSDQVAGAFTGEISSGMLKDLGCTYALVGHSERRSIYRESDEEVAKKFAAARKAGLIPVLCVGELLEEREQGITEQVVGRQLDAVIKLEGIAAIADAVVAYEPVWAIGTGKTASPEQAQEVHAFIRGKIASLDKNVGEKVQILYGGSVKGSNAKELFSQRDIDGGLIGGASLLVDDFLTICSAGDQ